MQHRSPAGTPDEWLRRARSNLLRAQQPRLDGVYWEDLCFDAQQAAEKAIKALLIFCGIPLRYTHDIPALITTLEQGGVLIPSDVRSATILTVYAVAARYPSTAEPVTEEDYREAISVAVTTVSWIEQRLGTDS